MTADVVPSDPEGAFGHPGAVASLDPLFDQLGDGYGGSAFVVGGAGLGKTTFLRHAEARARSWTAPRVGRLLVGRADGVLFGSEHAFRYVDQLYASLGADVSHGTAASNQDARRSNRFLSALRALDECSSKSPLLLLLDDLHWADLDSLAIVEFLCRQILTRPVAIIGMLRPWPALAIEAVRRLELDGCASVAELEPLSHGASMELLSSKVWGDVDSDVLEHASRSCGGNPLLIEEVARSLLGGSRVPAVEPFSAGRRAILLRRFAGVSDDTFRFLRAASTLGRWFRSSVAARMVAFDAPKTDAALEEAVAAGVLGSNVSSVRFLHPMFRRALYQGLQDPLRAELHEAAFRAIRFLGGSAAEAAGQAVAAGLTDEVAKEVVYRAGLEALESGEWPAAKLFLSHVVKAAGQTAGPDLICELAEALVGARSPVEAVDLLEGLVDRGDLEQAQLGRVLVTFGRARVATGHVGTALACFEQAAEIFETFDKARSIDALLRCSIVSRLLVGPREAVNFAERARRLSPGTGPATRLHIDAAWGAGAVMLGSSQGFDVLASTAERIEADPTLLEGCGDIGWWPLVWCSGAAVFAEKFEIAKHMFELGFATAESRQWPTAMAAHLVNQADLMIRLGCLDMAEHEIDRLELLLEPTPSANPFLMVLRTRIDLERGLLSAAESGCKTLETILGLFDRPPPGLLLWVMRIRGELDSTRGRTVEACDAFERAEQAALSSGVVEPCIAPWWVPALDCYRQAGRFSDLERVVTSLERVTNDLPCHWPRAGALAGRAMLSEQVDDPDSAYKYFGRALEAMDGVPMPIERATLLTWQGAFYRRQGEMRRARPLLFNAFQVADGCGAGLAATRARTELRLAGGRLRRTPRTVGGLTPRESQVAGIASTGHSTSEIAGQLGIATKTVEHHLEAVYRKLGVKSRRELMTKRFSGELELHPADSASTGSTSTGSSTGPTSTGAPSAPDAEPRS